MDNTVSLMVVKTLRQIIRAVDMHSQHLKKTIGLTGPQLLLLNEINRNEEIATGDLAKAVNLAQATVTSIVDRLEKKELVIRNRSLEDKRRVYLTLTQKAQILLEASPSFIQDEFLDQFDELESWEQSLILSSLQCIAKMMNAHEIQTDPILTGDVQEGTTIEEEKENNQ